MIDPACSLVSEAEAEASGDAPSAAGSPANLFGGRRFWAARPGSAAALLVTVSAGPGSLGWPAGRRARCRALVFVVMVGGNIPLAPNCCSDRPVWRAP